MTDYYKIGSGLGDAYLEGQKFRQDRELGEAELAQRRGLTARTAGLADDEAYARTRSRGYDAQYDAETAPPAPGAPAANGAAPPTRGLPAQRSIGDGHRALAADSLRRRDAAGYAKNTSAATSADAQDAFQKGSNVPDEDIDKLVAKGNQNKDFPVTMVKDKKGYEIITVRPDGSTSKATASAAQMREIMGYRAMMGVDARAALQGIAKIDADLATAFGVRLEQLQRSTTSNNTAMHSGNQDTTAARMADAAMVRAQRENATSAKLDAKLDREASQENIAGQAAGLRQGYLRAKELGTEGKAAQGIYSQEYANAQTSAAGLGVKLGDLNERAAIDPVKYQQALKTAMESGAYVDAKNRPDPVAARMAVDQMFGIDSAAGDKDVLETLRAAKAAKGQKNAPPVHKVSGTVAPNR